MKLSSLMNVCNAEYIVLIVSDGEKRIYLNPYDVNYNEYVNRDPEVENAEAAYFDHELSYATRLLSRYSHHTDYLDEVERRSDCLKRWFANADIHRIDISYAPFIFVTIAQ